jgi:hypothetical protein
MEVGWLRPAWSLLSNLAELRTLDRTNCVPRWRSAGRAATKHTPVLGRDL